MLPTWSSIIVNITCRKYFVICWNKGVLILGLPSLKIKSNYWAEFKKHNSSWTLTQCIMSDKDMTERNVLSEQFPQSKLLICLFHTLHTMQREVSTEKLGMSQGERCDWRFCWNWYMQETRKNTVSCMMSLRMLHRELSNTLSAIGIAYAMNG